MTDSDPDLEQRLTEVRRRNKRWTRALMKLACATQRCANAFEAFAAAQGVANETWRVAVVEFNDYLLRQHGKREEK